MIKDYIKIGANTGAQIAARGVTTFSTLLVTLLVTHNLSRADWGAFVTITSYVALFYVISDFGLNGIVTRELVSNKEKIPKYFFNLVALRIILSVITVFLALATLSFTGHSSLIKFGIIIALINVLSLSLFNSAVAIFQTKLRYDQAAVADISGSVVTLVLTYLFIISGLNIIFVVIAFVLGGAVRAFISLTLSSFPSILFKFEPSPKLWRYLLITSLPIGLTLLFSQFAANIDKQIIYLANYDPKLNLNNEVSVGIYGLAYRVFEFGIILPAFFVNSVYPLLIRDKKKDINLVIKNFFKYGKVLLGLGFLATLVVFIFSPFIVSIFGEFSESSQTLRLLSISYPLFFITPLIMWTSITLGKEKMLPVIYGFAALFNLAANLYFVPKFGFNSAAIITVVTEVIILVWIIVVVGPIFRKAYTEQNDTG